MRLLEAAHQYFKFNWLMPKAWISLCKIEEIAIALRHHPEAAPFACWHMGSSIVNTPLNRPMVNKINLKCKYLSV